MDFRFTQEQERWRREIRQLIEDSLTPELLEEGEAMEKDGPGPEQKRFMRMLGEKGLLGISWPKEYGGLERSLIDQYIFSEEMGRHSLYANGTAANMVGPTIMRVGTDEQKVEWLPKMLRGEVECSLGYTEPGAGTDLAGLSTRAVLDPGRPRRRRLRHQRSEDVHQRCPLLVAHLAAGANRSRRAEAP